MKHFSFLNHLVFLYMDQLKFNFKELANEIHKPYYKPKVYRQVEVDDVNETWTCDLEDLNDVKQYNNDIRYILVVMDVKSRYVWAKQMKDKTAKLTNKMFKELFKEVGAKPKYLWCDQGKEFYNKDVEKLLSENNIQIYSTFGDHKAALIERFNKTLKGWMYKSFTENNDHEWINILDDLIEKYNNKIHSTLGISPREAYFHPEKIKQKVRFIKSKASKYKVGDLVRIAKSKGIFEKGYTANWSIELFKILKVLPTTPVTYQIEDLSGDVIQGSFYDAELLKTKLIDPVYLIDKVIDEKTVKGKKMYYVSWLGYRENQNSWVNEKDMMDV